jgi:FkbM family methyltransferase
MQEMTTLKTLGKNLLERTLPKPIWNRILLARMRKNAAGFRAHIARHTYGGHSLQVQLSDVVGQDWYDKDWPVLPEIALLQKSKLKAGAKVFDIGAHQGIVAMMLGKIVGPDGTVIAIEANPSNARIAETNCSLNQLPQVRILQRAISDKPGKIVLNEDSNGQVDDSGSLGRIEVEACTIDELTATHGAPQVLFLDIEGFETFALQGATQTLARRPDCFIEVHVGTGLEKFGGSVQNILSYFPKDQYELHIGAPEVAESGRGFSPVVSPAAQALMKTRFHLVALAK